MLKQAISKNSILLALFAIAVAALIAFIESSTREKRAESLRKVKSMALEQVIPATQRDNILLDDYIETDDAVYLKLKAPGKIHIAKKQGIVTGFIIPTRAPDGYAGSIMSIVGVDTKGKILGVRILQHQETPGLGDKVDTKKSDWVFSFNGKSLDITPANAWAVKKDKGEFDQFTGATITPRAVVKSIHNALVFFQENPQLFSTQTTDKLTMELR